MSERQNSKFTESITRHIVDSRKQVTILFTDIEYSTFHWDILGDVDGRLMVDRHNRLLFPIIKKFRGKIIKTIGDAIMASFRAPEDAVKAAIGIQQILHKVDTRVDDFRFKVRIGVHTGTGIVERKDVYGDVVNVAAKLQSRCKGGEILITANTAAVLDGEVYKLSIYEEFVPRGKRVEIPVYRCDWSNHRDLVPDIKPRSFLSVSFRDKLDMGVHATASVGITYFLYLKYLRYIIADFESLALVFLNPKLLLEAYPSIKAALTAAVVVAGVLLVNLRTVPLSLLRLLRGGFGFCAGFLLLYFATALLSQYIGTGWNVKLFHSTHLFVEVLEDSTAIHTKPSTDSPVLKRVNSGTLLLLTDLSDQGVLSWNKVLVSPTLHGWIQRFTSAKFDQSTRRLTQTEKFYFRYQDLLALLAGLTGFLWGIASFRIRPV